MACSLHQIIIKAGKIITVTMIMSVGKFMVAGIVFLVSWLLLVRLILYWNFKNELSKGQFLDTFEKYKIEKRWSLTPWERGRPTLLSRYKLGLRGSIISLGYIFLGFALLGQYSGF